MTLALPLLLACAGPAVEDLSDRTVQQPLEPENRAPAVEPAGDDPTPEGITLASGFDLQRFHWWTHMRGFVHADPGEVWAALREPDVMVDRRTVEGYELTDEAFRPDVDFSYLFTATLKLPGNEFAFDVTWLHTVEAGDLEAPERVVATWELTDGPPFLERIEGSVELEAVEPGLTEIRGIFHLRAWPQGAGSMEQYWRDLHGELLDTLAGEPLATYD